MNQLLMIIIVLLCIFCNASSFLIKNKQVIRFMNKNEDYLIRSTTSTTNLQMGLFDSLFGPKKTASAAHILVNGKEAKTLLLQLKQEISKSKNVEEAFSKAARQYSSCPSAKNGGNLGNFKQGQMVPAFDKVVFSESLNTVHGPVSTPFGEHLIYITSRSE